jgi:hypothetical protein
MADIETNTEIITGYTFSNDKIRWRGDRTNITLLYLWRDTYISYGYK